MIRRLLWHWVVVAIAVGLTAAILPGIHVDGGLGTLLWIALVFGIVDTIIGTIVKLLALPLVILTLGLILLVINAAMLGLTAALVDSLSIDGFGWALLGSILISLIAAVTEMLLPGPSPKRAAAAR
jgi:putative membrane protein